MARIPHQGHSGTGSLCLGDPGHRGTAVVQPVTNSRPLPSTARQHGAAESLQHVCQCPGSTGRAGDRLTARDGISFPAGSEILRQCGFGIENRGAAGDVQPYPPDPTQPSACSARTRWRTGPRPLHQPLDQPQKGSAQGRRPAHRSASDPARSHCPRHPRHYDQMADAAAGFDGNQRSIRRDGDAAGQTGDRPVRQPRGEDGSHHQ
jgi:hypothetical protein